MIDIIKNICKTYNPKTFSRLLLTRPELKNYIEAWNKNNQCENISEIFFCISNDIIPPKCICGKKLLFNTFAKGYRKTCGGKTCKYSNQAKSLSTFWKENPDIKNQMVLNQKNTILNLYGIENYMQSEKGKEAYKSKYKAKTGYNTPFENPNVLKKCKETLKKEKGVETPFESKEILDKARNTYLKNHNGKLMVEARKALMEMTKGLNTFQLEEIKEKSKRTRIKNSGYEYASQDPKIRNKIKETNLNTLRYDNPMKSPAIKGERKHNNFIKYGVFFTSQRNYSPLAIRIINNKCEFENYLRTYGIDGTASILKISRTTIQRIHHKFCLNVIQPNSSSYEKEIFEWLTSNHVTFESNTRSVIPPLELDIYIPDYKLAIEIDGLFWHSEYNKKDKNYHINKTNLCTEKGIRLIHIFEDEWLNKKEVCLDLLSRFLCLSMKKIMARKCQIKEMANNECKEFLNENHLQGYTSASINIGLFYENELVELMTFKNSRYNKKYQYELLRLASKTSYVITGGTQKLWKYFISKYSPTSIVSYCDRRWFVGNTYNFLNFTKIISNKPTYWYTDYRHRFHRTLFTKQKCIKLALNEGFLINELENKTEKQIASDILELDRIWDCGQDTWIWKNKALTF